MQRSPTAPDEFIASLPDRVRDDVAMLDVQLARIFAGHERVLWEGPMWGGTEQRIIGYGTYRYEGRGGGVGDWFVVGLAAQKAHLSLYVSAAEGGVYLARRYADRLGKVRVGSANVAFRGVADLDLPVLLEMAERARDLVTGPHGGLVPAGIVRAGRRSSIPAPAGLTEASLPSRRKSVREPREEMNP